jgi:thiamine-phosphate pyrophosphorylase
MRPELTPAALRALAAAVRWADRLTAPVGPRHVLLGLLEEEGGRVPDLFDATHPALSGAVRQALAGQPEPLGGPAPDPLPALNDLPTPLWPLAHEARRLAHDDFGEPNAGTDHLLLAVAEAAPELGAELAAAGADLAPVVAKIRERMPPPLELEEPLALAEVPDRADLARILDANANRAREALRVLEEYARFSLDDATLTGDLKKLRHDLTAALTVHGPGFLLEARATEADVGTDLTTPAEEQRDSLLAVVRANAKRLQEALRSLEEYGKVHSPALGRAFEAIRYRSYVLERALLLGGGFRDRLADARLYLLLSGAGCAASLEWTIQEAVAGGVQVVQLREKGLADRELLIRARNVRRWTRQAGALFVMNDRPDLARLAEADGVHVGQEELGVRDVRRIAGPETLVGVSTHDLAQVRQAVLDGASYLGVGPVFSSGTKGFAAYPGLAFVRQAAAATSLPAFAIGGITPANVAQVVAAGLRRVAVSQAICQADEPQAVAAALRRALEA